MESGAICKKKIMKNEASFVFDPLARDTLSVMPAFIGG
jgi:hypothetical protein